ncbi:MAG: hypothetical protein KAQ92_05980, partial [Candidatus Aenigmarchaeota archaeon]|nr:hypothetical protein [Candidatus Aenigmarchaeota archaeon]
MESFSILMMIGTGVYILYELFKDEENELITKRLLEYSPEKIQDKKERTRSEEENANVFLKETLNTIAQNIISKSKNILAHKQMLIESGMTVDDETYLNYMSKKLIYTGICGILGLFLAVTSNVEPHLKLMLIIIFPLIGFRFPDMKAK